MGQDRMRQIFNIVGKHVVAPSKGCQGLPGPHQPQRGARTAAELDGLVRAGCVDDIGYVFSNRWRNADAAADFLQFGNILGRCHGFQQREGIGLLKPLQYPDLFVFVRIAQLGF